MYNASLTDIPNEILVINLITDLKTKVVVTKDVLLEKIFLAKEVNGRTVQPDEIREFLSSL
jgi:hypothetical protein